MIIISKGKEESSSAGSFGELGRSVGLKLLHISPTELSPWESGRAAFLILMSVMESGLASLRRCGLDQAQRSEFG